ncbi:MAG TPA: hypothetical protein GX497_03620 [Bacillus bacterium]|nr:hypothetical protein [Bacillus sp. (in: firmicutes)]
MLLDYRDFIVGAISVMFTYALFKGKDEDDEELDNEDDDGEFTGKHVTMSCQTCRKLKKHREVEHNLFQCTKCKRHVDLR